MARAKTLGGTGTNQYQVRGTAKRINPLQPELTFGSDLMQQAQTAVLAPPEPTESTPTRPAIRVSVHAKRTRYPDRPKAGRIYINIGGAETLKAPTTPMCSRPECTCGGQEVDHKIWNAYKRQALRQQRAVMQQAGLGHLDMRFSSKAGCSCGCSPGFITQAGEKYGTDTWVIALIGDPQPNDAYVVSAMIGQDPNIDAPTLIQWVTEIPHPQVKKSAANHPNCPPHLRAIWTLSG